MRDAIRLMRIISKRVLNVKDEICLNFKDWQKGFYCVDWTRLLEIQNFLIN
jgi:hypothetical protein